MRWRPVHRPRDGDHPQVLGCRARRQSEGMAPHDRREVGDPKQRRPARHRHPRARPAMPTRRRSCAASSPGFGARPSAKTSIGKVFQDRAAQLRATRSSSSSATEDITYREANETVNRYAAVLAARGVGHGDVVGIMLRNSPRPGDAHAGRGQVRRDLRDAELPPARRRAQAQPRPARPRSSSPIPTSSSRSTRCGADTDGLVTLDEFKGLAEPRRPRTRPPRRPCSPRTRRSTSSPRAPPACRRPAS